MKWMRDAEQKGVEREKAHCKPDSKMKLLEQMDTKCVVQLWYSKRERISIK